MNYVGNKNVYEFQLNFERILRLLLLATKPAYPLMLHAQKVLNTETER